MSVLLDFQLIATVPVIRVITAAAVKTQKVATNVSVNQATPVSIARQVSY